MEINSPPFGGSLDPEVLALPPDVRQDYERGMDGREFAGWPDGVPCFWLEDGRCRHYAHRPAVCRNFRPGSLGCLDWRKRHLLVEGLAP
ncbi:MAG: hypothetical protein FJ313_00900 [Gemmatimonadetes bacterium]|nr:hypothetical protein [Gemmatimonadota bacterium]